MISVWTKVFVFWFCWMPIFAFARITYQKGSEHLEYEARDTKFEFKVIHPFRVFKGFGKNIDGSFSIDLMNLDRGFQFNMNIEKKSVTMVPSQMTKAFQNHLSIENSKESNFKIKCEEFSILEDNIKDAKNFKVIMYCSILVFDTFSSSLNQLKLDCDIDGSVIRCIFDGKLKLSSLSIPVPRILFIDVEDSVYINGALAFVRKGI